MSRVKLDLEYLEDCYFINDVPVEYELKNSAKILVNPVLVKDSSVFLKSVSVLQIDKNSIADVNIIQMSYLDFVCGMALSNEEFRKRLVWVLRLCLGLESPRVLVLEDEKFCLTDDGKSDIKIQNKDFDNLMSIILHQNFSNYDDSYINPQIKKAMEEYDAVQNASFEPIGLERRISIISAHSGIPKRELLGMTFRAFNSLFEEVCGEVEFSTARNAALIGGNGDKLTHWIYKKKKNKYDKYFTSEQSYAEKMGANRDSIKSVVGNGISENLLNQFNKVNLTN